MSYGYGFGYGARRTPRAAVAGPFDSLSSLYAATYISWIAIGYDS